MALDYHGHQLANVKTGKYLGVTFASDLSWKTHVDACTKSVNSSLASLCRNQSSCPKDIKLQCYKSQVRPVLDYSAAAWDPHTDMHHTAWGCTALSGKIHHWLYRITSSTSQMIADLGLPSLELCRQHSKLMMMYQITYGLVDISANHHQRHSTTFTHGHGLEDMDGAVIRYWIPYCRTEIYRHFFFISGGWSPSGISYRRIWQFYRPQSHLVMDWLATPSNTDTILTVHKL